MKRSHANFLVGLASLLALIVLPLYAFKVSGKADYTDFDVYFRAALRAKHEAWGQIYNLGDGASPFRYAPPLLLVLRPLAELTKPHAQLLWYFIQYAAFALGFALLARALQRILPRKSRDRGWILAAALIFILRFCLDCFTIGQTSSLLFLSFCGGFFAYVSGRAGWLGFALFWPAFIKIGPGFLFGLPAASPRLSLRTRPFVAALATLTMLLGALALWIPRSAFIPLWQDWLQIVVNDSVYYDASHYGSQSVKSALLRAVAHGQISMAGAQHLWMFAALVGCSAVLGFWFLRKPHRALGRAAFFALGIFPYLWFMPETFKYTLTALAIPMTVLLATTVRPGGRDWLRGSAIVAGYLTLSAAGLDLVGTRLFFWLQRASVPLAAYSLIGMALARVAWRESRPRFLRIQSPAPQFRIQPLTGRSRPNLSLLIPVDLSVHTNAVSVIQGHLAHLNTHCDAYGDFEILIAPFAAFPTRLHPAFIELERTFSGHPGLQLLEPASSRGQATRDAYFASRGDRIACARPEQPVDPEFFVRAQALLTRPNGDPSHATPPAAVWANRRHPESRFLTPVKDLPIVHGRHLLGLFFNRLVRALLPIQATDTHSGSWMMTAQAARLLFGLQRTTGFLWDLEAHLILAAQGLTVAHLPVRLQVRQEKPRRRVFEELTLIARELPQLIRRERRGEYHPLPLPTHVTADDWGWTPGINQGILQLAQQGIVRRVSLMAEGPSLETKLEELKQVPGIELGLHFNLTQDKSSPSRILVDWMLSRGPGRARLAEQVRAELATQLKQLERAGVRATYLDGHHHIHLVPGLMVEIAPQLREAGITRVRLPWDPRLLFSRKLPLALLSLWARRSWQKLGFSHFDCFYPQARHFRDPGLLRSSLRRHAQAEIIVHPALTDDFARLGIQDTYTADRVREYRVLSSLFPETLT